MRRIERMDSWTAEDKGASTERQNHGGPQPEGGAISRQPVIGSPRGGTGIIPRTPDRASGQTIGAEE